MAIEIAPMVWTSAKNEATGRRVTGEGALFVAVFVALLTAIIRPAHADSSAATSQRLSGLYLGLSTQFSAGRTRLTADGATAHVPADGTGAGLMLGYAWRQGQFVYGVEAQLATPPRQSRFDVVFSPGDVVRMRSSGSARSDGRVRLGYVIADVLLHGSIGYGLTRIGLSASDGISSASGRLTVPFWLFSIGVDLPISERLFVRAALETSVGTATGADLPGLGPAQLRLIEHRAVAGLGIQF
jgi:hypothetical protein